MIYKWVLDNIKGDRWIWFIALSLSILSLLVVYSATGSLAYQKMQGNTAIREAAEDKEFTNQKRRLLVIRSIA